MKKIIISLLALSIVVNMFGQTPPYNFSDKITIRGKLFADWTYDYNWGGSSAKWSGYLGFNSYRSDNMQKDYYLRSNNYTRRMVFEGSHNGFRWLGETSMIDNGQNTEAAKLSTLMSLNADGNLILESGNLTLGILDNKGVFGNGNILSFCGTDFNSDPTEIYRHAVSPDVTQLRVRIGDGLSNDDKFIVGTAGNDANNWTSSMVVTASGRVGINKDEPTCELDVNGIVTSREIKVELLSSNNISLEGTLAANNINLTTNGQTADFVFESDYQLRDLSEVETFIKENKHLPEIPSAAQMEKQGVNLAEMNKLLLQKVEELTLYAIEKDKEVKAQMLKLEKVETEMAEIKALLLGNAPNLTPNP